MIVGMIIIAMLVYGSTIMGRRGKKCNIPTGNQDCSE